MRSACCSSAAGLTPPEAQARPASQSRLLRCTAIITAPGNLYALREDGRAIPEGNTNEDRPMKKGSSTRARIMGVLRQAQGGLPAPEPCHRDPPDTVGSIA